MGEMVGWTIVAFCASPLALCMIVLLYKHLTRSPEMRAAERTIAAINAGISADKQRRMGGAVLGDGGIRDPG